MHPKPLESGEPLRVLIADDSASFRDAACSYLRSLAGVVLVGEAVDGQDAVEQAARLRPDLVLMDVQMPRQNGIEATKRLRVVSPGTRIALFSLHADPGLQRAALAAGADGFFSKEDFMHSVGEVLAQVVTTSTMPARDIRVHGIAHDLNNLLGAILTHAELIKQTLGADHTASESVAQIVAINRCAAGLVSQLQADGRLPRPKPTVQSSEVLGKALCMARGLIPADVDVQVTVAGDVPALRADATQLHQVVLNLCMNAWYALEDSTDTRRKVIRVLLDKVELAAEDAARLGMAPRSCAYVRLSVSDNGVGMSAATRERIFEPFFTTREPGHGTGLGLSVVRSIVKAHDGAIGVETEPGAGTTFHVYLPAAAAMQ